MNISVEHLTNVIHSLHEFNPMMGHRGCRLDVTFPEIARMQTSAIIKAALAVRRPPSRLADRARDHGSPSWRGPRAGLRQECH